MPDFKPGRGVMSDADTERLILELVGSVGEIGMTEQEMLDAVNQANRMALDGLIYGLWQVGETSFSWNGHSLCVNPDIIHKVMQIQAEMHSDEGEEG